MSRERWVLLDRDGTIIVEKHYLADPDQVELIDGAAEALSRLARAGCRLAVVTNQSAIARGLLDESRLAEIHQRFEALLAERGAAVDAIYHCPHHPDEGCVCRKPATGMAERAAAEFGFDPAEAFVVGDMAGDLGLGRALGATTFLVRTGHGRATAARRPLDVDYVVDDLAAAAEIIEGLAGPRRAG